ncbi:MAG TPA: hypothetical protein VFE45_11150, partial [Coriobacteriia bacterium]|nr:hypothetical protein [Coriobacteriia bacterium]
MVRLMVLALAVAKVVGIATVNPSIYPDTKTYRREGTWLDFSLTSLDGASLRPWGSTIWLALWPGDHALMIGQALLSAVAWGALAVVVSAGIRQATVRRLTAAALVLIPCTAQIANWDSVIQGDSTSMSTGILALAALIWFTRQPTWGRAATFGAAALWFTMSRPNAFVILLCWALGLLVIAVLRRGLVVVSAVAALLVLFSVYSYAYNMRSDAAWTATHGFSRSTVAYAYPIGVYNPVAPQIVADLRKSDAPPCMIPEGARLFLHRGFGPSAWVSQTVATCPEMNTWATENWQRWYISWLLTHPTSAIRIIDSQILHSLAPTIWGNVVAATPNSVAALFLGTPAVPQDALSQKSYHVQPLILWGLAVVGLGFTARRLGRWRGSPWAVDIALAASVAGGLLCAISSGLLIQTIPFEVAQESLASTVIITAALVVGVGLGIDRVLSP